MFPSAEFPTRFGPGFRWLVWLLYSAAWSVALLSPLPDTGDWSLENISLDLKFLFAKAVHVSAYALLAVLSGWLPVPRCRRWLLLVFLSGHAMATEFFQQFVPGRTGCWFDVGIDHIGIALGLALTWKWWLLPAEEAGTRPLVGASGD
jgi:VanZ family protein